jgi:hypothetical protein
LIEKLADYIASRPYIQPKSVIVEVGAGDGSLSFCLSRALAVRHPHLDLDLVASDLEPYSTPYSTPYNAGAQKSGIFPVAAEDYKATLRKRTPVLVLCAWMPMNVDWTSDFREHDSLEEYILIGA